jgi:hypothetical protein
MPLVRDEIARACDAQRAERRVDCDARLNGSDVYVNGSIGLVLQGERYALTETAIKGLLARVDSSATSYVLSLRETMRDAIVACRQGQMKRDACDARIAAHKLEVGRVIGFALDQATRDDMLRFRLRQATHEVFAVVSCEYGRADLTDVAPELLSSLPRDARGNVTYDAASTAWSVQAEVWTPTPVSELAIGEAHRGGVDLRGRDDGGGSITGGGFVECIRCFNATVYQASTASGRRVHRGSRTVSDVARIVLDAGAGIDALVAAWGRPETREAIDTGAVPLSKAIPGFYAWLLRDRKSSLQGVLPGRSDRNVESLTRRYLEERRDDRHVTRGDLAQGFTRHAQDLAYDVRADVERGVGKWLVERGTLGTDARA